MPSPSVTSKASKKSRKSHKTAEKPSKQHKGPAEKVSKETVARVKKVVQNDVDDTGAPAHRVSAKLHRAQKTPHTEYAYPSKTHFSSSPTLHLLVRKMVPSCHAFVEERFLEGPLCPHLPVLGLP